MTIRYDDPPNQRARPLADHRRMGFQIEKAIRSATAWRSAPITMGEDRVLFVKTLG